MQIRQKVDAGERLSAAEGEFLFSPEVDLHAVGELADVVRRRKNGDAAYYNFNAHQPDQRLRLPLRAVRLQPRRRRPAGLRDERR